MSNIENSSDDTGETRVNNLRRTKICGEQINPDTQVSNYSSVTRYSLKT